MSTLFAYLLFATGAAVIAGTLGYRAKQAKLRRVVWSTLDDARKDGHFEPGEYLHGADARTIAFDLRAYSDEAAYYTTDEMEPHVRAWLESKGLT